MMLAPHSARRVETPTRRMSATELVCAAPSQQRLRRSSDSVAAPSQQRCAHHERSTGQGYRLRKILFLLILILLFPGLLPTLAYCYCCSSVVQRL